MATTIDWLEKSLTNPPTMQAGRTPPVDPRTGVRAMNSMAANLAGRAAPAAAPTSQVPPVGATKLGGRAVPQPPMTAAAKANANAAAGVRVPPQGATAAGAKIPGYATGYKIGKAVNSPVGRFLGKGAAGVEAIARGVDAVDDVQSGDYGKAAYDGARSAAAIAAARGVPLAAAFTAGSAIGDQVYQNMDTQTQDNVGGAANAILNKLSFGMLGTDPAKDQDLRIAAAEEAMRGAARPDAAAPAAPAAGRGTGVRGAGYDDPRRLDLDPSRGSLGASRDMSKELATVPRSLPADLRDGQVYKTTDANGRTVYSGRNVAADANIVDGMGRTTGQLGANSFSIRDASGPGGTAVPQQSVPVSTSGVASDPGVAAALRAASARGDSEAVRNFYQQNGGTFNGSTAEDTAAAGLRRQLVDAARPGNLGNMRALSALDNMDRVAATKRGQDLEATANANRDATLRRGQDIDADSKMLTARTAAAKAAAEIQMKKEESDEKKAAEMDKRVTGRYQMPIFNDKGEVTGYKEDANAANFYRNRMAELGIDPTKVTRKQQDAIMRDYELINGVQSNFNSKVRGERGSSAVVTNQLPRGGDMSMRGMKFSDVFADKNAVSLGDWASGIFKGDEDLTNQVVVDGRTGQIVPAEALFGNGMRNKDAIDLFNQLNKKK